MKTKMLAMAVLTAGMACAVDDGNRTALALLGVFLLLLWRCGIVAHRIRGRVVTATRNRGGKANDQSAQGLAGRKRLVYGPLKGRTLL